MRYAANRSILLDGHLYAKGDIIECAMKRGRADLFIKTKAISKIDDSKTTIVTTPVEDTKTVVPPREVASTLTRKKT